MNTTWKVVPIEVIKQKLASYLLRVADEDLVEAAHLCFVEDLRVTLVGNNTFRVQRTPEWALGTYSHTIQNGLYSALRLIAVICEDWETIDHLALTFNGVSREELTFPLHGDNLHMVLCTLD